MSTPDTPGRRAAPATGRSARAGRAGRARFDVTTLAAVLLPVLAVVAALLVDSGADPRPDVAPTETPLTTAGVVCPAGDGDLQVATASGAEGDLRVRVGRDEQPAPVAPGRVSTVDAGERAAVVTGEGDLAPGLVAARFAAPLASFDCRAPVFEHWFTGVGAGARHQSVLQLVNPDEGRAVVDVEVRGSDGIVDVPALRGVAVRGGEARTIDLASTLPRRDELSLHVSVVRGRIAASVRDSVQGIGNAGRRGVDGLGAQDEPATSNLLLGVPAGGGPRVLLLANPGSTQERAAIELVTADATFAPAGVEEVVLPPESVVPVPLTRVLAEAGTGADRPLGVLVTSSGPTTASLQMFADRDLVRAAPAAPLEGPGTAVLPPGTKQLVLGGATGPGAVTVALWDADGAPLPEQRIEVAAGRAVPVDLPDGARLMTVTAAPSGVAAVVTVRGAGGATVVRVRQPVSTGLVPDVAPGGSF